MIFLLKGIDFNKKKSYIIDISNDVVANQKKAGRYEKEKHQLWLTCRAWN